MKYFVRVGGSEIELTVEGDEVHVDGAVASARLADVEGTPVRLLTIGDEVHRIVVRPAGQRGRYTIWVDGFRHEVEALDERMRANRELAGAPAAPPRPPGQLAKGAHALVERFDLVT